MICPKCKSDHLHRSHRRGIWEHLVSIFSRHPYRCKECGYRALMRRDELIPEITTTHAAVVEKEIKATLAKAKWQRQRRELLIYGGGLLLFVIFLRWITHEHTDSSNNDNN